jgi:hypothetical protein
MKKEQQTALEQLIASASLENTVLTYQLLQSQLGKSSTAAIAYLLTYRLNHPKKDEEQVTIFLSPTCKVVFMLEHLSEQGTTCSFVFHCYQQQKRVKEDFYYVSMDDYDDLEDAETIHIGNYRPANFERYIDYFCQEYGSFLVHCIEH